MNVISYIISIAMYILLSLGLQTIANRRGIRHAWLAWLPVGNVWVLASISDDFKLKVQGKQQKKRIWLPVLLAVSLVLSIVVLSLTFVSVLAPVMEVLTYEDLMAIYEMEMGDSVSHMYAPAEEEIMADIVARMEMAMTDETVDRMLVGSLVAVVLSLVMLATTIPAAILEYICLYNLFDSCEPQNKTLYLLLSLLLGVSGLCVFLCRDKDLGMMPPAPVLPEGNQGYWQQN